MPHWFFDPLLTLFGPGNSKPHLCSDFIWFWVFPSSRFTVSSPRPVLWTLRNWSKPKQKHSSINAKGVIVFFLYDYPVVMNFWIFEQITQELSLFPSINDDILFWWPSQHVYDAQYLESELQNNRFRNILISNCPLFPKWGDQRSLST